MMIKWRTYCYSKYEFRKLIILLICIQNTGGTHSSFSSFGLTGDLLIKPQLMRIGGNVYSTISVAAAVQSKLPKPYVIQDGTSIATPYVAGILALFQSSIGNPPPYTISGYAKEGICRPKFSLVTNLFQSTAKAVRNYNSALFATNAKQGAGLVNAFQALTVTTIFSPSELGLNDTVRKTSSYKVSVINIGTGMAVYKMSHDGAALATGITANFDQQLNNLLYSADYAVVNIEPTEFDLQPGTSREITLRFAEPSTADPTLLPFYSGFIYVTNQVNGEVAHLFYAGVVGDYGNARLFVHKPSSGIRTGVQDADGVYISDNEITLLNATVGIQIELVLAWSTRMVLLEVVPNVGDVLVSVSVNSGLVTVTSSGNITLMLNKPRNVFYPPVGAYTESYLVVWNGQIFPQDLNGNSSDIEKNILRPGQYKIKFSALKHFGNPSNPNDMEVFYSPPFDLTF